MTPLACRPALLGVLLGVAGPALGQAPPERPETRAVRVPDGSVRLDGRLDEAVWASAPVASGFRQVEPAWGAPAALDTRVRVVYDARALYVGAVLRDTLGDAGLRVRDLRRDFDYFQTDHFSVALDPFGDGRDAVAFQVSPFGALRDLEVRNGTDFNREWDAVWDARTARTDSGWTVEIAIPWTTLRYPGGGAARPWGVRFSRMLRRGNEQTGWPVWQRARNSYTMEDAGRLVGLEPPPPGRNVRVQPYALAQARRVGAGPFTDDSGAQVGGDLKWALTPTTVLDLTLNTDFAQADADQQVVNLSRFSVFFPERRAFFLESADVFQVGYALFTPFYSRRIGLDAGRAVPLDGGARLVSAGPWGRGGVLAVRQRGDALAAPALFGVGRASLNVGAAGRVGGMLVARHDEAFTPGGATPGGGAPLAARTNVVATLDGFARLGRTAAVTAFVSASQTTGEGGEGLATYLWARNNARWGYAGFLQDLATAGYTPAAGFVFRRDVLLNSPAVTLDLRPAWLPRGVRSLAPAASAYTYHRPSDGAFLQADLNATPVQVRLADGSEVRLAFNPSWQHLDTAEAALFRPLGVALAPGRYRYGRVQLGGNTDPSRRLAAEASLSTGGYFDGRLTTWEAKASAAPSPRLGLRATYTLNDARRLGPADARVRAHLVGADVRAALSPRLQGTLFAQYNSLGRLAAVNARVAWEYRPLSFVYLVVGDNRYFVPTAVRQTEPARYAPAQTAVVKVSLLRPL